jgi:hypothetical protein
MRFNDVCGAVEAGRPVAVPDGFVKSIEKAAAKALAGAEINARGKPSEEALDFEDEPVLPITPEPQPQPPVAEPEPPTEGEVEEGVAEVEDGPEADETPDVEDAQPVPGAKPKKGLRK